MFKKLYNPILFQGRMNKKNYFEGWYFKMVSADKNYSLAIIPGISLSTHKNHAFIQVFVTHKNENLKTIYIEYETDKFLPSNKPFGLNIEKNSFTENHINLAIVHNELSISGKLKFTNITKIEKSLFSPSIMGFFGYFTFMECYHGVVSMLHNLQGELLIDGKSIDFNGGIGYIEKDWGKSFPREYVWMQSNHFSNTQTSFMFSEAIIPFLGFYFKGLIVNLIINGKEYRFATYNGAKVIKKEIRSLRVYYEIKKANIKLSVEAINEKTTSLSSPKNGAMVQTIKEGLSGIVRLQLIENDKLIYEDTGTHAGLEIMMAEVN